jgi:hypothetical protein
MKPENICYPPLIFLQRFLKKIDKNLWQSPLIVNPCEKNNIHFYFWRKNNNTFLALESRKTNYETNFPLGGHLINAFAFASGKEERKKERKRSTLMSHRSSEKVE